MCAKPLFIVAFVGDCFILNGCMVDKYNCVGYKRQLIVDLDDFKCFLC